MRASGKTSAIVAILAAAVAVWLLFPRPASASSGMETVLQDDPKTVYEDNYAKLDNNLRLIASLGVDTIRVSLYWHLVAPQPTSRRRPSLGRTGSGYLTGPDSWRWHRYDRIVELAARNGLNVMLSPTGPAPRWATRGHGRQINNTRPSAGEYYKFVRAAGVRYSGTWPDPSAPGGALPRVIRWSFWNEANFPSWLLPQWKRIGRHAYRAVSPSIYRRLADAGWSALKSSGHPRDVVLLGETAPFGPRTIRKLTSRGLMSAPQFVREIYCLDARYRPFRGAAARSRGCPATASGRRRFRSRHPVLFHATGWAHHAYSLTKPPNWRGRKLDAVPLAAISRLTRTLDRSQRRWGRARRWPVWVTEYGYQTYPPDPFRGISWNRQAAWMSWAEYVAFRNPRVGAFAQFLLVDDAPRAGFSRRDPRRWITWQSGFITTDGTYKPAMNEFRAPIYLTPVRARRGRSARIFGIYRLAPYGTRIEGRIEFAPTGGSWKTLSYVTVTNPRGYLLGRIRPPGTGSIRIVWTDPRSGRVFPTRAQFVSR